MGHQMSLFIFFCRMNSSMPFGESIVTAIWKSSFPLARDEDEQEGKRQKQDLLFFSSSGFSSQMFERLVIYFFAHCFLLEKLDKNQRRRRQRRGRETR